MEETNPFSLKGKSILITGASSGIGRQTAISCSHQGARVILLGRNKERLIETNNMLASSDSLLFNFDLTDSGALESFIKDIKSKDVKLNGVVHSAGMGTTLPFKNSTTQRFEDIIRTNVFGPMELSRNLIMKKIIKKGNSSIVFISSIMGVVGEMGKTIYSTSKGALTSAVRSLAIEYADKGIRFNSISPGVVKSPMSESSEYTKRKESHEKIETHHPLGIGEPDDVANACVYLLSDASKWVTGTNLIVDGGYTAR